MKHKVLWLGVVLAALFWQTAAADCDYCTAIQGTSPPYRTVTDLAGGENSNLLIRMALLYHGAIADIEATDDNGWTMLHWAVEVVNNDSYGGYGARYIWGSGNQNELSFNEQVYQAAKVYMHKRANPNIVNNVGESALIRAVAKNDERMVNILLGIEVLTADDLSSDLSVQNRFANTEQNNDDPIGVHPDVDRNNIDGTGVSSLMYAVRHSNSAIVRSLLNSGASINDTDSHGNTALFHFVPRVDYDADIAALLLTPRVNITAVNTAGENILEHAIHYNNVSLVADITALFAGEDALYNHRRNDSYTPLMLAAQLGRTEIINLMITRTRIDPYIINHRGRGAFLEAAYFGHADILLALYDRYGQRNGDIISPEYSDINVAQTLNESYLDKRDSSGASPLLAAADREHFLVIQYLIGGGADVNIQSCLEFFVVCRKFNNTPLLYTIKNGDFNSFGVLLFSGADVNLANADGITPLILAASLGRNRFVQRLLDEGADFLARDNNGLSALEHARSHDTHNHREIVKLIRERITGL